jgi:hypothetical protein
MALPEVFWKQKFSGKELQKLNSIKQQYALFHSFPSCTWERKWLPGPAWRVKAFPSATWEREKSCRRL